MLTTGDLKAIEGFRRRADVFAKQFATANGAATVLQGYRTSSVLGKELESFRRRADVFAKQFATANGAATVLQGYRTSSVLAKQLTAVAAPVWLMDGTLRQRGAAARALSINWLLFGQLTIRALFAAIVLALILAVWEEQKESAPAMAVLEIFGALGLWYQIDEAIWRRLS